MSKKIRKMIKNEKDFLGKILKILLKSFNKVFNYKQIVVKFEFDDIKSRNQIIKDLKIMVGLKKIIELESGKYLVKVESQDYYEGIIDMISCKIVYFICEDFVEDVFILINNLNRVLDKDRVKVYVYN